MKTLPLALALALALHLLTLPPTSQGVLEVPVQKKTKAFNEYFNFKQDTLSSSQPFGSSDYFIPIYIGTPPQYFTILLDTISTGIWVISALCPSDVVMCKYHRKYDRSRSKTYIREGQMMGYAHMVAELSIDTVTLGGGRVSNQTFAEAIQYTYNFCRRINKVHLYLYLHSL